MEKEEELATLKSIYKTVIMKEHVDSKMAQEKNIKKKEKEYENRKVIYIGHLPHGFYEQELKDFFSQFGIVTRVRVVRSRKTGNSRGFAFIEFKYEEVAKIAAETMNNYLMYGKILKCNPVENPKNCWPRWDPSTFVSSVEKNRRKHNSKTSDIQNEKRKKRTMNKLKKISDKLAGLGIKYSLNVKLTKRRKSKEAENCKSELIPEENEKLSKLETVTSMKEDNEEISLEANTDSCQLQDSLVKKTLKNKNTSLSRLSKKASLTKKSPKFRSFKNSRLKPKISIQEDGSEENSTEIKLDSSSLKNLSIKEATKSEEEIESVLDSFSYPNRKTPLSKKSPKIQSCEKKNSRLESVSSMQESNEESSAEIKLDSSPLKNLSIKEATKSEEEIESVSDSFSYPNRKTSLSKKSPKIQSCEKKNSRLESVSSVQENSEESSAEIKLHSSPLKNLSIKEVTKSEEEIQSVSDSFSYPNRKTSLSKKSPKIQSCEKKNSRLESISQTQENNEECLAEIKTDSFHLKDLSVINISKNKDNESSSDSFSYLNRKNSLSRKSPKDDSCKKKESRMEPVILIENNNEERPTEVKIDSCQLKESSISSIKRISENKDSIEMESDLFFYVSKKTPLSKRSPKLRSCKKKNTRLEMITSIQQNNEENSAELKRDSCQLEETSIKKISKNNKNDKSVLDSFSCLDKKILAKRSPKNRSCKKKTLRLEPVISMQEDKEEKSADVEIDSIQLKDSIMKENPKIEDNIESVSDSLNRKTPLSKRSPKFRSCKKKNLRLEAVQENKEKISTEIKSDSCKLKNDTDSFSHLKRKTPLSKQSSTNQSCKKMNSRLKAVNLKQEDNEEGSTEKKADSCQAEDSVPKKKFRKNEDIKSASFVHLNTKTPLSKRSPKFRSCKKTKPV